MMKHLLHLPHRLLQALLVVVMTRPAKAVASHPTRVEAPAPVIQLDSPKNEEVDDTKGEKSKDEAEQGSKRFEERA